MGEKLAIAVVGTFDSKAEEHIFLKDRIEQRGVRALTINVGTKAPSPVPVDLDLYKLVIEGNTAASASRDQAIDAMIQAAKASIKKLYESQEIAGMISAGGGTGTHIGTRIMHELPLGAPKVMVSTVASRNMAKTVGTKDITMIHSVADLLGVNSVSGRILDNAAAGICGMVQSPWQPQEAKKRIALPFFGFITPAAEATKHALEQLGYEVVANSRLKGISMASSTWPPMNWPITCWTGIAVVSDRKDLNRSPANPSPGWWFPEDWIVRFWNSPGMRSRNNIKIARSFFMISARRFV
jgi:uncharacterized protein (UPF0261 family)